jgi:cytochrome b pre-mRNA-processing protein 3
MTLKKCQRTLRTAFPSPAHSGDLSHKGRGEGTWWPWKRGLKAQGEKLCREALKQARAPIFYESWGVPDTLTGRFDMACLHVALLLRITKGPLAQKVFDAFFSYTELTLREVGVSDLRVGKQVKKCATFFYGAMKAYDEALDQNKGLEEALLRNIYGNMPHSGLSKLATYVKDCDHLLNEKASIVWPPLEVKED